MLMPIPFLSPQEFLWEKEGSDAPLQLSSDSVLIFPFLNKSDSGTYVCTATSSMGSVVAKYNLDVSGECGRSGRSILLRGHEDEWGHCILCAQEVSLCHPLTAVLGWEGAAPAAVHVVLSPGLP